MAKTTGDNEAKVKLQVLVTPKTLEKIDELATVLGASRSGLASKLLEEGLRDNEWIIRRLVAPMKKLWSKWGNPRTTE